MHAPRPLMLASPDDPTYLVRGSMAPACLHPPPQPVDLDTLRLDRSIDLVCYPAQRLSWLLARLIHRSRAVHGLSHHPPLAYSPAASSTIIINGHVMPCHGHRALASLKNLRAL